MESASFAIHHNRVAHHRPSADSVAAMMDDTTLITIARENCSDPARDALILRHSGRRDRIIGWLASSTEMRRVEIEDARQNAVFWTLEAIEKYNTTDVTKTRGCSFCTFLNRVLACRFKDYLKHLRRRSRHVDWSLNATGQTELPARPSRQPIDPAAIAEVKETIAGLDLALGQMDAESIRIWELLGEGASLREISIELGISYDAVKRRRRKLIQHLRNQLATAN